MSSCPTPRSASGAPWWSRIPTVTRCASAQTRSAEMEFPTAEHERLVLDEARGARWKRWGPYLAERQWATVREDYSANGDCWNYFPHDHARRRGKTDPEFELIDTGAFEDGRYFDVFIEYAKGAPEDIAIRIRIHNRGPEAARIDVLPTLWFRNTWSWGRTGEGYPARPSIRT